MAGEEKLPQSAREIYDEVLKRLGPGAPPVAIIDAVVAAYAARAGGLTPEEQRALTTIMTGIATQESGLVAGQQSNVVDARGRREESYGLFQNNLKGRGAGFTATELVDPILNTVIAVDAMFRPVLQGVRQGGLEGGVQAAAIDQRSADVAGQVRAVMGIIGGGVAPSAQTVPSGGDPLDQWLAQMMGGGAVAGTTAADFLGGIFSPGDDLPSQETVGRVQNLKPLEIQKLLFDEVRGLRGNPAILQAPYVRRVLVGTARGEKIETSDLVLAIDDLASVRRGETPSRPAFTARAQQAGDQAFLSELPKRIAARKKLRQQGMLSEAGAPTSQEAAQEMAFIQ